MPELPWLTFGFLSLGPAPSFCQRIKHLTVQNPGHKLPELTLPEPSVCELALLKLYDIFIYTILLPWSARLPLRATPSHILPSSETCELKLSKPSTIWTSPLHRHEEDRNTPKHLPEL